MNIQQYKMTTNSYLETKPKQDQHASNSVIPNMLSDPTPSLFDLKTSVKIVVEDCSLNKKSLDDINNDIKIPLSYTP